MIVLKSDRGELLGILNDEETKLVLFIIGHFSESGNKALGLSEKDLELMKKMQLFLRII